MAFGDLGYGTTVVGIVELDSGSVVSGTCTLDFDAFGHATWLFSVVSVTWLERQYLHKVSATTLAFTTNPSSKELTRT